MSFSLTILGSSGALPAYGRFPSSQYLTIQNRHFLIDCGEGSQLQLSRYGISIHKIDHIFISHLHGDHYLGLTGLLFSMHLLHRESDIHIYSFRGLDEILLAQLKHARSVLNFRIIFHVMREQEVEKLFEDDALTIESIPLDHKISTNGFLFREKPRALNIDKSKLNASMLLQHIVQLKKGEDVKDDLGKVLYRSQDYTLPPKPSIAYAYCSDTQPKASISDQIKGVNLLYHEATFMEEEKSKARETRHSTAREAAEVALQCGVGKLIIGHFSARYKFIDNLLAEARVVFPETYPALEGDVFSMP